MTQSEWLVQSFSWDVLASAVFSIACAELPVDRAAKCFAGRPCGLLGFSNFQWLKMESNWYSGST